MNDPVSDLRARNLRTLAMLAGLFLLPLVVAFWMYYASEWRPARRINHGELISPARTLPVVALQPAMAPGSAPRELFRHDWSLVYIGVGSCTESCRHTLYVMRQVRLSLNNEMARVERIFLVTADCCASDFLSREHPGLAVLDARDVAAVRLLQAFPDDDRENSLYIVDPLGNLMMRYDARQNPQGLLEDLKKLLTLSHIG